MLKIIQFDDFLTGYAKIDKNQAGQKVDYHMLSRQHSKVRKLFSISWKRYIQHQLIKWIIYSKIFRGMTYDKNEPNTQFINNLPCHSRPTSLYKSFDKTELLQPKV